jgi:DNA polymerase-3 subunit gamma/tau
LTGAGEAGAKKKQAETARPVSFRNILPVAQPASANQPNKPASSDSAAVSGVIAGSSNASGSPAPTGAGTLSPKQAAVSGEEASRPKEPGLKEAGAKLLVDYTLQVPVRPAGATKLGSLSKIRQQFSNQQNTEESNSKELTEAALQQAWNEYAQQLREDKNPALQSFDRATLRIEHPHSFEVITNNNLEQKFIEGEKRKLSDFLQKAFSNKSLSFWVSVKENTDPEEPGDRPLNTREQFLLIVERYPLVKELKDRLKLDLDY